MQRIISESACLNPDCVDLVLDYTATCNHELCRVQAKRFYIHYECVYCNQRCCSLQDKECLCKTLMHFNCHTSKCDFKYCFVCKEREVKCYYCRERICHALCTWLHSCFYECFGRRRAKCKKMTCLVTILLQLLSSTGLVMIIWRLRELFASLLLLSAMIAWCVDI